MSLEALGAGGDRASWPLRTCAAWLAALAIASAGCSANREDGRSQPTHVGTLARVVRVIDGDTVVLAGGARVRYIGMDTPERGQPGFVAATRRNAELVGTKRVRLVKDVSETDRYGRLLRYVYVEDTLVNARLVQEGYARVFTVPPDVKYARRFLKLQRAARGAARGLWAP